MEKWITTPAGEAGRQCYRIPGKDKGDGFPGDLPEKAPEDQISDEDEELILCRQCGRPITRPAERIEVAGAHKHTFANPHGIVFEIGCFRSAFGCGYTGPTTGEFTWFQGYRWKVAVCGSCAAHLGWLFTSNGSEAFHGLILDRIKSSE
jgi:hypothetical protein